PDALARQIGESIVERRRLLGARGAGVLDQQPLGDVELDQVGAGGDRRPEPGERVLGGQRRGASVPDDERAPSRMAQKHPRRLDCRPWPSPRVAPAAPPPPPPPTLPRSTPARSRMPTAGSGRAGAHGTPTSGTPATPTPVSG